MCLALLALICWWCELFPFVVSRAVTVLCENFLSLNLAVCRNWQTILCAFLRAFSLLTAHGIRGVR